MNAIPCQIINRDFGLVFIPSLDQPPPVFVAVQHCGLGREIFQDLFLTRNSESVTDLQTLPLALDLFRSASPHVGVVYNQFNRRYVETNVHPADAYRDERLAGYYDSFHQEIAARIIESSAVNGPCVLLDLHGFGDQPAYAPCGGYDAILGTGNRSTVRLADRTRRDEKNNLDYQFRDELKKRGLSVFCPEFEPVREKLWREKVAADYPNKNIVPRNLIEEEEYESDLALLQPPELPDQFNGGYLIRKHSENSERVAAAIQIELAYSVRDRADEANKKRDAFIKATTDFIKRIYA